MPFSDRAPPTQRSSPIVRPLGGRRLVHIAGPGAGQVHRIDRTLTIGRDPASDLRVDDADSSRQHARLVCDGDRRVTIEDLESTNGTFVNGERVTRRALQPGDHVQVGASLFVYVHSDEITERVQQIQKLQALGSLASTLSHDFKNIFQVLEMNLDLVDPAIGPACAIDPELQISVEHMRGALTKAKAILQRLMQFGRREVANAPVLVDASLLVERTTATMRRGLVGIQLEVEVEPGLFVVGETEDLHQVLLNLILNARDAMPRGGRLTVTARAIEVSRVEAYRLGVPVPGPFVELRVEDTGTGIDEAVLGRIFEPYFTTKAAGKGTGLGLSTVYGIAGKLGGNVLVESRPGQGTTFRVLMAAAPLHATAAGAAPMPRAEATPDADADTHVGDER